MLRQITSAARDSLQLGLEALREGRDRDAHEFAYEAWGLRHSREAAAIGLLSAPTMPRLKGMDSFRGPSFHTYHWPKEPVELAGTRVAVIRYAPAGDPMEVDVMGYALSLRGAEAALVLVDETD